MQNGQFIQHVSIETRRRRADGGLRNGSIT